MPKTHPPKHLRLATRRWFASVVANWDLEEHHVRLLTLACEAFDRGIQSREIIEIEGLTVRDRFNQARAHPLLAVERDSRQAFSRLVRELDLDLDSPARDTASRPPMLRSVG